ncbi:hypothetical protein COB52_05720, partial [Candidatus Kaiserbacteria bacterium]
LQAQLAVHHHLVAILQAAGDSAFVLVAILIVISVIVSKIVINAFQLFTCSMRENVFLLLIVMLNRDIIRQLIIPQSVNNVKFNVRLVQLMIIV